MDYFVLIGAWVIWCTMHSFLISPFMIRYMQTRFPGSDSWYRLFYNSFSLTTLAVPLYCMLAIKSGPVFSWEGIMQIPRFILLLSALILFREGARKYDLGFFLGIKQLKAGGGNTLLSDGEMFAPTGIFGIIRHPWYAGSLLLVWSGLAVYTASSVITASILSIYLVLGTFLEERKILVEYGESYRNYQRDVSMLFPWKWSIRRLNALCSRLDL